MTKTLFDTLYDREFGRHVLYVPDLLKWAEDKRFHLLKTLPAFESEFVPVEELLLKIEVHCQTMTHEEALVMVENDAVLKYNQSAILAPVFAKKSASHLEYRNLLSEAISAGELELLDFVSKLPIASTLNSPGSKKSLLTPRIEEAKKLCGAPYSAPAVWTELCAMATEKKSPFIGQNDDGLLWENSDLAVHHLSLKNLRDRLDRQKTTAKTLGKTR